MVNDMPSRNVFGIQHWPEPNVVGIIVCVNCSMTLFRVQCSIGWCRINRWAVWRWLVHSLIRRNSMYSPKSIHFVRMKLTKFGAGTTQLNSNRKNLSLKLFVILFDISVWPIATNIPSISTRPQSMRKHSYRPSSGVFVKEISNKVLSSWRPSKNNSIIGNYFIWSWNCSVGRRWSHALCGIYCMHVIGKWSSENLNEIMLLTHTDWGAREKEKKTVKNPNQWTDDGMWSVWGTNRRKLIGKHDLTTNMARTQHYVNSR